VRDGVCDAEQDDDGDQLDAEEHVAEHDGVLCHHPFVVRVIQHEAEGVQPGSLKDEDERPDDRQGNIVPVLALGSSDREEYYPVQLDELVDMQVEGCAVRVVVGSEDEVDGEGRQHHDVFPVRQHLGLEPCEDEVGCDDPEAEEHGQMFGEHHVQQRVPPKTIHELLGHDDADGETKDGRDDGELRHNV